MHAKNVIKSIHCASVFAIVLLSGCSLVNHKQELDAYNARLSANQMDYVNGKIPLSEKLRRDYVVTLQYRQMNKIESECTRNEINLARSFERGSISEQVFTDQRESLIKACAQAEASGV